MNAGKSTSLLQSAYNYRERGMHSVIYTAALDDRYGVGKVTSRIGLQADAKLYAKGDDLFASISKDCEAAAREPTSAKRIPPPSPAYGHADWNCA